MNKRFSILGKTWNWYFIDDEGTLVAALLEGLRWIAADQVRNVAVCLKFYALLLSENTNSYILTFPCIKRNNINFYIRQKSNIRKKYLLLLVVDDWRPSYDNWTPWPSDVYAHMRSNSNFSIQRYRKIQHILLLISGVFFHTVSKDLAFLHQTFYSNLTKKWCTCI